MLGGVKEANYIIAFEITLMQRAMIQASYVMLTGVISLIQQWFVKKSYIS